MLDSFDWNFTNEVTFPSRGVSLNEVHRDQLHRAESDTIFDEQPQFLRSSPRCDAALQLQQRKHKSSGKQTGKFFISSFIKRRSQKLPLHREETQSVDPKTVNFSPTLSGEQTTPLTQVTVTWTRVSFLECHIPFSRIIITVFSSLDLSCFCLAFSSCYGNAATRLAAFEIKSKSRHANKAGVVFICGDAFLCLQRRTVFDGSELVICSSERSRSSRPRRSNTAALQLPWRSSHSRRANVGRGTKVLNCHKNPQWSSNNQWWFAQQQSSWLEFDKFTCWSPPCVGFLQVLQIVSCTPTEPHTELTGAWKHVFFSPAAAVNTPRSLRKAQTCSFDFTNARNKMIHSCCHGANMLHYPPSESKPSDSDMLQQCRVVTHRQANASASPSIPHARTQPQLLHILFMQKVQKKSDREQNTATTINK